MSQSVHHVHWRVPWHGLSISRKMKHVVVAFPFFLWRFLVTMFPETLFRCRLCGSPSQVFPFSLCFLHRSWYTCLLKVFQSYAPQHIFQSPLSWFTHLTRFFFISLSLSPHACSFVFATDTHADTNVDKFAELRSVEMHTALINNATRHRVILVASNNISKQMSALLFDVSVGLGRALVRQRFPKRFGTAFSTWSWNWNETW